MAKRVNTKFLIGLTATVGGLAVAGFAAALYYARHHHNAQYYLQRAHDDEARQDWPAAAGDIGNAIVKQRSNTALYVQLAGYFERMVTKDPVYLGKANQAYRAALEVDPTYTPAIDHLLAAFIAEMRMGVNNPTFFNDLSGIAKKGIDADGNNPHYQTYYHIGALQQWMSGSTQSNPQFEKEVSALSSLAEKHPEESDAAFYASQAQFKRFRELWNSGQSEAANAVLDRIADRHQAAIKARPQDSQVQLRAYTVFSQLATIDPRPDRKPGWQTQANGALAAAYASAKPTDDAFDDVQSTYAAQLRGQKASPDDIQKALTAWTTARPHDPRARLELANYVATLPGKRPEAVKLVEVPVDPDPDLRGYAAMQARQWDRARLIALNTFRVENANAVSGKDRDALLAPVDADLVRIASMGFGEDANLLKLRGKTQMLHNKPVEAIKSFERAQTLLGTTLDLDLWFQLNRAYKLTGQTGNQQRMMEDLLARAPGAVAVRVQLADVYLSTSQNDKAAGQLKILKASQVTDPNLQGDIRRIEVEILARQNQADDARKQYAMLPEVTRADRLFKARMASDVNEPADGARLYRLLLHDDPADPDAVIGAINLFVREKNLPQAQQVVADAIKAQPNDPRWSMLREQLSANTPEAIRKLQDNIVQQTSDPMLRALRTAQLAMDRGQWAAANEQLDQAQKLNPDDNRVLNARIEWFLLQRQFAEAAPLVDRAAAANADQMDGLAIRTRFALTRNDAVSAVKYGTELVGKHDEFALNWLLLARAQQMAGNYRDAVASCDAAVQRQPNNVEALKIKAACLESLAQYPDEKNVIAEARRLAPDDVTVRDLSLNYELHHGDPDAVIATCEQLLQSEPENPALYAALGQACEATAQSKYHGDAAASKKLLERARAVLNQGISRFANSPDVNRFYGPLAIALDGLGDSAGAEDLLKKFAARPDQQHSPDANRELARFYERHNRNDDALKAWQDAYTRSAESTQAEQAELDLSQFLVRHGQHEEALKVLASGPSSRQTDPRVQNQKIETLMGMGAQRMNDALKLVDQVYGADSSAPAALYYRGLIALTRGDVQAAVRNLQAARDKDPQNAVVRIWLARALLAQNRRDEASAELVDVLQRNPLRDDARTLLLTAYSSEPNPRWNDFVHVVEEAETNPVLATDPAWHQLHARGLAQRGQFAQAKAQIDAARKLAPDSFALWEEYVNLLVRAKDWKQVLEETDQQIAAGHKEPSIFGKRGIARAGLADKNAAAHDFDTGLDLARESQNLPGIVDLLRTMAQVLGPDEALSRLGTYPAGLDRELLAIEFFGQKGDYASQIKTAETALQEQPTPPQRAAILRTQAAAYLILSKADKEHPQWDKARRAMDQLLLLEPNDTSTLNNAAYLLCQVLNDPQSARPYSARAYDQTMKGAQDPNIIDTRGWVLTLCGGNDSQQGLLILKNLVDSNPALTKARYHLVEAYIRQGRLDQASDHLKVLQQQLKQMQDDHAEIDTELLAGVAKAEQEIRQKSGRAGG